MILLIIYYFFGAEQPAEWHSIIRQSGDLRKQPFGRRLTFAGGPRVGST